MVKLCQTYGRIVSAKAIVDRKLNHCKGYGFVMFEKEASAAAAVDGLLRQNIQVAFAKVTRAQIDWDNRQEASLCQHTRMRTSSRPRPWGFCIFLRGLCSSTWLAPNNLMGAA
jgi:hypothetical protein